MYKTFILVSLAAILASAPAFAQTAGPVDQTDDCDDPDTVDEDECLALLPIGGQEITNFVPLIGPIAAALGFAALAAGAGGGGTSSTPTTPNN